MAELLPRPGRERTGYVSKNILGMPRVQVGQQIRCGPSGSSPDFQYAYAAVLRQPFQAG